MSRIFSVAYMLVTLLIIVFYAQKSDAYVRISLGLGLFVVLLLIIPVLHLICIQGWVGFYLTVAAVALSGMADTLVEGSLIGVAGESPEKYMRAIVAGTADSCNNRADFLGSNYFAFNLDSGSLGDEVAEAGAVEMVRKRGAGVREASRAKTPPLCEVVLGFLITALELPRASGF